MNYVQSKEHDLEKQKRDNVLQGSTTEYDNIVRSWDANPGLGYQKYNHPMQLSLEAEWESMPTWLSSCFLLSAGVLPPSTD